MTKNSSDLVQPPFPMPYDQADKKSFFDDLPNYLLKNNSWYPRFPNRNLFSVTRRFILSPQKCFPIFACLSLSCNPTSYRMKFYSMLLRICPVPIIQKGSELLQLITPHWKFYLTRPDKSFRFYQMRVASSVPPSGPVLCSPSGTHPSTGLQWPPHVHSSRKSTQWFHKFLPDAEYCLMHFLEETCERQNEQKSKNYTSIHSNWGRG